ncbi:serine hydrolase domain-containing protein [Pilimelia terevasa]|nr:serine hydrolase domain-containing protein [Pilimelia terevasa]
MPADVRRQLARMAARVQADARVPALAIAVHRADRAPWTHQLGTTGNATPLDADTQFRLGSVTKTFTAVLVMQCRDDGLLELDDTLDAHLPVPAHGRATVRQLLSHTSGLQREPYGDVWDTLDMPDVAGLVGALTRAERILPPGHRYHYSNLGVALLGHLVARVRGGTWAEVLAERILAPLGLAATTVLPTSRTATGHLVDTYSDHARPEPDTDFRALGPACQLWGTAADLARWSAFLADPASCDPAGRVLAPGSVEEMRWPLTVTDDREWHTALGLGLMIAPRPGRAVQVGHYGAMPGYLAAGMGQVGGADTPPGCGVGVLGSAGTADAVLTLAHDLLTRAVELDPADIAPWSPAPPAPAPYRSVLGRWWSEGTGYDFSWRDGQLQARAPRVPAGHPPSVFAPLDGDPDVLRTVSGRETGELLRLTRDDTGTVVRLHWATYRFTRRQETFDGVSASDDDITGR